MLLPRKRREALRWATDAHGERAVLLHLDGQHEQALEASTTATRAAQKLHRADRKDRDVRQVLAARLRDRADIRRELGNHHALAEGPSSSRALAQYRAGLGDVQRAVELLSGTEEAARYPLLVPSLRLLGAEFLARAGARADEAARDVQSALTEYRSHSQLSEERGALDLAWTLARVADVLLLSGDEQGSLAARRESVERFRPWLGPEGVLWRDRHQERTTWVTTPTLERAGDSALALAVQLQPPGWAGMPWPLGRGSRSPVPEPPDGSVVPEALHALQDAGESFADSLPKDGFGPAVNTPAYNRLTRALNSTEITFRRWLEMAGASELAMRYHEVIGTILDRVHATQMSALLGQVSPVTGDEWSTPLRALRPSLEQVARSR
ncbi:hypothetical protein GCM10027160_03120 [Streptomyces calidiresistens]|uniref:Uncharacterized protein n=1 Tax=Streptomyces calidiresistens TaxID=1485586 RepID=A0A7W3T399_9ACTN|nr:hypothetical protein [Streptomyces calidiresistens]MBB0230160.1 hypothetical protein [Streptomyces calidiresistens]